MQNHLQQNKQVKKSLKVTARALSFIWEFLKMALSVFTILLIIWVFLQFKTMYNKMQTITELQSIIKNLKANYPIADMKLVSKEDGINTVQIAFYNGSGEIAGETQKVSIEGEHIYIDCTVYNFTYSLIETGEVRNIAVPIRIYSELISPDDAISLHATDSNGIPYSLYCVDRAGNQEFHDLQLKRLKKLLEIIDNPEKVKELGIIRSIQQAAVANASELRLNRPYHVMVENTGGLTLKRK
ncbi:MAG: hypothetical protein CR988_02090 [Treponema sp.]|nr:MAG: hypothetical protein CR988_02090 [Treponema sp.]